MRVYLYILAGWISALIGWSLGQFFISDLSLLKTMPEIVLFPCVAISLAVGMVLNEIFLSSPTRPKLNFRSAPLPLIIAAGLGLAAGLLTGIGVQALFALAVPAPILRIVGWLAIGTTVGFAEGFTWRFRSVEAGNTDRFYQRFRTSVMAGTAAGLVAALLFELLRLLFGSRLAALSGIEDPIGFSILGILLGLAFSLTISPSYMVALRAGAGFEYVEYEDEDLQPPRINTQKLTFISKNERVDEIEEGLSVQLPEAGVVVIGSSPSADVCIPNIAEQAARIEIQARKSVIIAMEGVVDVNGSRLKRVAPLKHNHILTFWANESSEYSNEPTYRQEFYRFVYYNRFLDPQS